MKKFISFFLAVCIILITVFSVGAYMPGDIDKDREITANDARTVLRAAVGLETLSKEDFLNADIDNDGTITSSDARMVLRAAVGLEILHIHEYGKWEISTKATCTKQGEKQSVCSCGERKTITIPALQHKFADGKCSVCKANMPEDYADIPRLDFTGDISNMNDKKDERKISVTYTSKAVSFSGAAKLKVQGTSSLKYAKKNYTINLYEDSNLEDKMKVDMGWGKQSKYCLKANWIDKTHARNVVSARLAADMQAKYGLLENTPHNGTVDGFPIEIYSNGEFLGIYTFNIPKDAWLFNMDEDNPNHLVFCGEKWLPANYFNAAPDYESWAIEIGEENDYSLGKLKKLFDFIMNSSDEDFVKNFEKHLSLDSTLNYFIFMEFAFLSDNRGKNMLLVTYDGEKWYPSLYDLDSSWGTDWTGKGLENYKGTMLNFSTNRLWSRLMTLFSDELAERYSELRSDVLSKENILDNFYSFTDSIPQQSFDKETAKWGTSIPGFGISQIADYLDFMIPRLDVKYGLIESDETTTESEETTTESEEITTESEETTLDEETTVAPEETTASEKTTTENVETTAVEEETSTEAEETTIADEESRSDS